MEITWDDFNAKNKNKRAAFENLCRTLFLRQHKKTGNDYNYNYNHPGLETDPILNNSDEKWYGFQCKYFDDNTNSTKKYDEILKSVNTALKFYKGTKHLDCIYIYTNVNLQPIISISNLEKKEKANSKLTSRDKLAKMNYDMEGFLEWKKTDNIIDLLNDESNFDLLRLYFDKADILGYLDDSVSIDDKTLIDSDEYINLKFDDNKAYSDLIDDINKDKASIILGTAGTGKSLLLKKIYLFYVDLFHKNYFSKESRLICCLPVIINLNLCIYGDVVNAIRKKLSDYSLNYVDKTFDYIYIFDGLDEVPYDDVIRILEGINSISGNGHTKAVIASRTDSPNYLQISGTNKDISKHEIGKLNIENIKKYFKVKSAIDNRNEKLISMYDKNSSFFDDIDDVLSINLLWKSIKNIDENDTKISLIGHAIDDVIKSYKKIASVGLLESTKDNIIDLCKHISYMMAVSKQTIIGISDVQALIVKHYPNSSNNNVNSIISALCDMFLQNIGVHLTFNHRRYQEYFLFLYIKDIYFSDPSILRRLNLLSNPDFVINIFITQLLQDFKSTKDVLGCACIGLLEAYLGSDYLNYGNSNYQKVKPSNLYPFEELYSGSEGLLHILSCYDDEYLESLLNNKNIGVSNFIGTYSSNNMLKFLEVYHRKNGIKISKKIDKLFNVVEHLKKVNHRLANSNYYEVYCQYMFSSKTIDELYSRRNSNKNEINIERFCGSGNVYEEYRDLYSVFKLALEFDLYWIEEKIEDATIGELELISYAMLREENLSVLLSSNSYYDSLKNRIIEIFGKFDETLGLNSIAVYCLASNSLDEKSKKQLKIHWNDVREKYHVWTWHDNYQLNHAICYLLDNDAYGMYNFAKLGCTMFISYYLNYNNKNAALKSWLDNIRDAHFRYSTHLRYSNSVSLGKYISFGKFDIMELKRFILELIKYDDQITLEGVLWSIYKCNRILFLKLCNRSMLEKVYSIDSQSIDEYEGQLESDFRFAAMFYEYDKEESNRLFIKGINNSFLRPVYRKEDLVDYMLVHCLCVAKFNFWLNEYDGSIYADRIYQMLIMLRNTRDSAANTSYISWFIKQYYTDDIRFDNYELEYPIEHHMLKSEGVNEIVGDLSESFIDQIFQQEDLAYSLEAWVKIISSDYFSFDKLLAYFDRKYFPHPGSIKSYSDFYYPVSILIEDERYNKGIFEYLYGNRHRDTPILLLLAYASNSDSFHGKKILDHLFLFSEMLVYDSNYSYVNSPKKEEDDVLVIVYSSKYEDWIYTDDNTKTYKYDKRIVIQFNYDDRDVCVFEWATKFPDKSAYRTEYDIMYIGRSISSFALVAVDGGRANLPFPRSGTMLVPRNRYNIARLFNNSSEEYQRYLVRSGLVIE